jgi:aspartate/methionine/tyrosine aminotransferase
LFIIATSLLQTEDELIVTRPNYATNIETPLAIGCKINFIDLTFENQFALKASEVEKLITPKTKLISITTPHNPTGTIIETEEINKIIALAEKHNCYVLVDETYRDLTFDKVLPLWSSKSKHVISVSSLSKAFGLPGIRIGWLCTSNADLMELFLSAKEQIFITNSLVDEELAYYFMQQRNELLAEVKKEVSTKFTYLKNWMSQQSYLEWVEPKGGVVAFPRFIDANLDTEKFYKKLYSEYKTMVGPGHWFEMNDRYFRLGFGWYKNDEFEKGLDRIEKCF